MTNEVVLLGLTEAAKRLQISVVHLRSLCDQGALPSIRDSAKRRLFKPDDVAVFKQQREREKKANGKPKLHLKSRRAEVTP